MVSYEITDIVQYLADLNVGLPTEESAKLTDFAKEYEIKFQQISSKISFDESSITPKLKGKIPGVHLPKECSPLWKYIGLNLELLSLLKSKLGRKGILSIEQSKKVEDSLKCLSALGISSNLMPSLPHYLNMPSLRVHPLDQDELLRYHCLKFTVVSLIENLKNINLRPLIVSSSISRIITALYQLSFAKVSKPKIASEDKPLEGTQNQEHKKFAMTEEIYQMMLQDQKRFREILYNFRTTIHPNIFIRENLALLQYPKIPMWLLKEVSLLLTEIIRGENGVVQVTEVVCEGFTGDTATSWRCIDVCTKLILSMRKLPDFESNTCKQLFAMMEEYKNVEGPGARIAENIFIHCIKSLYQEDKELCTCVFIPKLYGFLENFTAETYNFDQKNNILQYFAMNVQLIHGCLCLNQPLTDKKMSLDLVKPVIVILFRIYSFLYEIEAEPIANEVYKQIKDILFEYLTRTENIFAIFDAFLFNKIPEGILAFRKDLEIIYDKTWVVKTEESDEIYSEREVKVLDKLFQNNPVMITKLFSYFLNCMLEKETHFSCEPDVLLENPTAFIASLEQFGVISKYLSNYMDSKEKRDFLLKEPEYLLKFIEDVFEKAWKNQSHLKNPDDFDYQCLYTTLMIVEALASNCRNEELKRYQQFEEILQKYSEECFNSEMKSLINLVLKALNRNNARDPDEKPPKKSEYDNAMDDICDKLLPVRGHGLMVLAKLVEKKDKITMEKKNYVLTIFQQNLKSVDSYIYLNAVRGLAALANVFTDTVLTVLCEEYSDFTIKNDEDNGIETRMKLGEVLVRVIKELGELAPKYKPLLLNTFLGATKDDDHFIRASSLSNLGEVCRVLGYKIEPVLLEIMMCVNSIIMTDKSLEARRAAVTVIRQIFAGLGNDTITIFREEILPTYRLLKHLYYNDKDDVMKLQAQLTLEQLNENLKDFAFPTLSLHDSKNPVVLK